MRLVDFMKAVENDTTAYANMGDLYNKMIGLYGGDLTPDQQDAVRSGDAFKVSAMIEKERHILQENGSPVNTDAATPTVTWVIAVAETTPAGDIAQYAVTPQVAPGDATAGQQDPTAPTQAPANP